MQGTLPIFALLIRGDEALEGISRCFGGLSFQEGIAVHIVDQVAEAVVLTRSFQSDAADVVHSHLLHSPEDVFHSHSDLAHASGVSLGSMVVYQSKGMGVLVKFPDNKI